MPSSEARQLRTAQLDAFRFAALDVETTGLFPAASHRIVEVAVVLFTLDGTETGRFETLINPQRDVGAQDIHGLTASDLANAPLFSSVCGHLVAMLRDRIIVAHNAGFDLRFLEAEFHRAAVDIPVIPRVCTMQIGARWGHGQRLSDVCANLGVTHHDPHTALGDARATADILVQWYHNAGSRRRPSLADLGCMCLPQPDQWPEVLTASCTPVTRSDASRVAAQNRAYLGRLLQSLPATPTGGPPDEATYLDLLEKALEDRFLSPEEADELASVARDQGLTSDITSRLHRDFFESLAAAAWADGRLSQLETDDLCAVAEFLSIGRTEIQKAIAGPPDRDDESSHVGRMEIGEGMTVCFTGVLRATMAGRQITREQAHGLAQTAGLVVQLGVTKGLNVLVVADPLTMSGKARKAREYGTRIVAEAVFWAALGIETD